MNENDLTITLNPRTRSEVGAPRHPREASTRGWLTTPQAARYIGLESPGGRAPTSVYEIAHQIGRFVGNRWLIHSDDLDEWIRSQERGQAA